MRLTVIVISLSLLAAVAGYAAADVSSPDAVGRLVDGAPAGLPFVVALVTITPDVPSEGDREFVVEVLADGPIAEVELLADGEVVDRFVPDGEVSALRTVLHHSFVSEVNAVVRLADGREAVSPRVLAESPVPAFGEALMLAGSDTVPGPPVVDLGDPDAPLLRAEPSETLVRWEGPGRLNGGFLEVDDPQVGRVFAYASDDHVRWHRIPAAAGASLPVIDGRVDVRGRLPALDVRSVEVELWRQDQDEVALLGYARASVPSSASIAEANVEAGLTGRVSLAYVERPAATGVEAVLVEHATLPFHDRPELWFEFDTDIAGVTHVLWQAFSGTGSIGPPNPLAPHAVRIGVATVQDGRFRFVPPGEERETDVVDDIGSTSTATIAHTLLDGTGSGAGDRAATLDGPQQDVLVAAGALLTPEGGANGWTLRALALAGDHYLGIASNPVQLELAPPLLLTIAPPGDFSLDVDVAAPTAVDPSWQHCFQVAAIDQVKRQELSAQDPIAALQYGVLDAMLADFGPSLCLSRCYTVWVPAELWNNALDEWGVGGFAKVLTAFAKLEVETGAGKCDESLGFLADSVVSFGTSIYNVAGVGYDLAESTYNGAKQLAVTIVAELSGCKTLLNAGAAVVGADADKDDTEALCRGAATIAVDAALLYLGLPPSLPDREQLIQNAKGDLAGLLVQLANDYGVPCDELATAASIVDTKGLTCEEIAGRIVDKVSEEMADAVRANAAKAGLPFPPGVSVIQDVRSTADPLRVTLTTTPEPGKSLGPACEATMVAYARWTPPMVTFPYGALFVEQRRLDLSDKPYNVPYREYIGMYGPTTVTIPRPATPSSTATATAEFILSPPVSGFGATAFRDIDRYFGPPERETWDVPVEVLTLRPGATIDVYVTSDCAGFADTRTTIPFFAPVPS